MESMSLRKWKIGLAAVVAIILPSGATAMQWPDTEQRNCYDNEKIIPCPVDESSPFYGQDAQHDGPSHSYTKLGWDGLELDDSAIDWVMVRDNVTGLIWEMKNSMDNLEDGSNPNDADNTYTWCKKSIKVGVCDGLDNTDDFIDTINGVMFGGYDDWRLPNVKELATLLYKKPDHPLYINLDYFNPTMVGDYWSSDKVIGVDGRAWVTVFFDSMNSDHYHGSWDVKLFVRAVRAGN